MTYLFSEIIGHQDVKYTNGMKNSKIDPTPQYMGMFKERLSQKLNSLGYNFGQPRNIAAAQPSTIPAVDFSNTLGSIINQYESTNATELPSSYIARELAKTKYSNVIDRSEFKDALKFVDNNTNIIPGQKVQCMGWTALIEASGLGSGISISAKPGNAIDLIPKNVLAGTKSADAGGRTKAIRVDNLSEIKTGDVFVLDNGTSTGHAGKFVEVKQNGKVFTVTEGNKNNDGKIETHDITEQDFEKKMAKLGKVFVLRPYTAEELKQVAMLP